MHNKLAKTDPLFKKLVKQHGKISLPDVARGPRAKWQPYQALVRSIAYQQLHGKAAETIFNRFLDKFGGKFPTPQQILKLRTPTFRACGFSGSKTAAIKDIAKHTIKGTVPDLKTAKKLKNEELIARLTQIRGVGQWTVEMFMIFTLGRTDVLSAGDFGVRNGYRIAAGLKEMPNEKEFARIGQRWAPYGSLACLYLWRAADVSKLPKAPTKTKAKPATKQKPRKKIKT
ncbi:MAG: DNA-3-methyladenine glycosylase [Bdellovibrionales bacterium]